MNKNVHPVVEHMLSNDAFSEWMGIDVLASEPGYCKLSMTIRVSWRYYLFPGRQCPCFCLQFAGACFHGPGKQH